MKSLKKRRSSIVESKIKSKSPTAKQNQASDGTIIAKIEPALIFDSYETGIDTIKTTLVQP